MTKCKICGPSGLNQYRCNCQRRSSPKVRAHLDQIRAKAVANSSKSLRIKSFKKWAEMVKGMTVPEAWRFVYNQGYKTGHAAAKRRYERVRVSL